MLPIAFTLAIGWLPHGVICNASLCFDLRSRVLSTQHTLTEICGEPDVLHASLDSAVTVYAITHLPTADALDDAFASFDLKIARRQRYGGVLRGSILVTDGNFLRFLQVLAALDYCVFGAAVVPASYVR